MLTTPIDLELDAAKRQLNAAFDNFVKMVHNVRNEDAADYGYPEDYTADEFINDFMENYWDYIPQ